MAMAFTVAIHVESLGDEEDDPFDVLIALAGHIRDTGRLHGRELKGRYQVTRVKALQA